MKRLGVFLLPLDGMLVHRRSFPRNFVRFPQQFAGTHLYSSVERGTVRVKCLSLENSTVTPARARTRTARSGYERTNHLFYFLTINFNFFFNGKEIKEDVVVLRFSSQGGAVASWLVRSYPERAVGVGVKRNLQGVNCAKEKRNKRT